MKKYIILFILIPLITLSVHATNKVEEAETLYNQKNYIAAIDAYNQIISADSSLVTTSPLQAATIYYNLGNCYYRVKDFAKAVFSYQQSLRLNPSDKDAQFNLQLTQSKLQDQFDEPSASLFVIMLRSVMFSNSATAWGYTSLLLLMLASVSFYLFRNKRIKIMLNKIAFATSILSFALALMTICFAYVEHNHPYPAHQAVILQTTQAYSTPSATSKTICELHSGVLINIITTQDDGWLQVQLPDNATCWIRSNALANLK